MPLDLTKLTNKTLDKLIAAADDIGVGSIEDVVHHYGTHGNARQMAVEVGIAWQTAQRFLAACGYTTAGKPGPRKPLTPEQLAARGAAIRAARRARAYRVMPEGISTPEYAERLGIPLRSWDYSALLRRLKRENRLVKPEVH